MVKIAIIGWYGTETIGDRAILAGILSILNKVYGVYDVKLGSIYPFFTERTLLEDSEFYRKCANNGIGELYLFDSQNSEVLDAVIKWCDILVMGGGPLMGMWSLYMIEYAFAKAKRLRKHTLVLGCGVGPMIAKRYERSLIHIIGKADITIFRDEISVREYRRIAGKHSKEVLSSIDPAVFAAQRYKSLHAISEKKKDMNIVACVRDFPMEYRINDEINGKEINEKVFQILMDRKVKSGKRLLFLPMHYFTIGGDDRRWMNKLKYRIDDEDVVVQNTPLSLEGTLQILAESSECVGMRFHSIVLQTILNGNNIVLNYTHPDKGKIVGFLKQIGAYESYQKSFINLQVDEEVLHLCPATSFKVKDDLIAEFENVYLAALLKLF